MHADVSGRFDWKRLGMQPLRRLPTAAEAPNGGRTRRAKKKTKKNPCASLPWKCANTCVEQTQSHPRCTAVLNKNAINGSRERLQVKYIAEFGKPKGALYLRAVRQQALNRLCMNSVGVRFWKQGLWREKGKFCNGARDSLLAWDKTGRVIEINV